MARSQPTPRPLLWPVRSPVARQSMRGGDAVANPFKTPKLLDVEMDQAARFLVVVAPDGLGGDQVAQTRQPGAAQHPADRGGRNAGQFGNVPTTEALAAVRDDALRQRRCGLGRDHPWSRRTVQHAVAALGQEPVCPAANDLGRHAVFPRRMGFGNTPGDD